MSWRGPAQDGSKDRDADPYTIRHNAPVSIVHAAKVHVVCMQLVQVNAWHTSRAFALASLKDPTRPVTPADFGRQLFSKESEFSQNRPPSAYGLPNSKAFFDNGSKLPIAKLDPFARRSSGAQALNLRSMCSQTNLQHGACLLELACMPWRQGFNGTLSHIFWACIVRNSWFLEPEGRQGPF
eukprot:1156138-Pelagomonas_calceolata.AAC.11